MLQPDRPLFYPYFVIFKDTEWYQDAQTKQDTTQLLITKSRCEMLFQVAHSHPMARHLGQVATLNRLMARFFWPGIRGDVSRWCAACQECQLVNPPAWPKAPLHLLPLIEIPFYRIVTEDGSHRAIRTISTRALICISPSGLCNVVALRIISPRRIVEALFHIISQVGIPKEMFTDQDTAFMSRTLRKLYKLFGH